MTPPLLQGVSSQRACQLWFSKFLAGSSAVATVVAGQYAAARGRQRFDPLLGQVRQKISHHLRTLGKRSDGPDLLHDLRLVPPRAAPSPASHPSAALPHPPLTGPSV